MRHLGQRQRVQAYVGCQKIGSIRAPQLQWYFVYSEAENQHFTLQGRLVAPINVKFGITERHVGPLDRAKFHLNWCTGVGTRPQKSKISTSR